MWVGNSRDSPTLLKEFGYATGIPGAIGGSLAKTIYRISFDSVLRQSTSVVVKPYALMSYACTEKNVSYGSCQFKIQRRLRSLSALKIHCACVEVCPLKREIFRDQW